MSTEVVKNKNGHIIPGSKQISRKIKKLEIEEISKLPRKMHQWTEKQLEMYIEYLEYLMTDKELRFVSLYEDPQSDTYGNRIRSFAKAYGHEDKLKEISSREYDIVNGNAHECWFRPRVQKYVEVCRFKKGHNLSKSVSLANSRLTDLIEQVEDKQLTLQAIKELHRILGNTNDGVNIQINNNDKNETQFDFSRLTDDEMVEYMRLLNKLKVPADTSDENNIEQAEVIDNEDNN